MLKKKNKDKENFNPIYDNPAKIEDNERETFRLIKEMIDALQGIISNKTKKDFIDIVVGLEDKMLYKKYKEEDYFDASELMYGKNHDTYNKIFMIRKATKWFDLRELEKGALLNQKGTQITLKAINNAKSFIDNPKKYNKLLVEFNGLHPKGVALELYNNKNKLYNRHILEIDTITMPRDFSDLYSIVSIRSAILEDFYTLETHLFTKKGWNLTSNNLGFDLTKSFIEALYKANNEVVTEDKQKEVVTEDKQTLEE